MPSQPKRKRGQPGYAPAWVALFVVLAAGTLAPAHAGVSVSPVGVDIQKFVNGEDANTPTGPVVEVGSLVTFTYVVRPVPGSFTFPFYLSVIVSDDDPSLTPVLVAGNDGGTNHLDFNEVWTFTASALALPGQHSNLGKVEGQAFQFPDLLLGDVFDVDLGHYFGGQPPNGSVAEPSTLLLLGAGLVSLGYFRRSRR